MRRALVITALLSAGAHAADAPSSRSLWSRLWQTDDQYAQRLLRAGDAAGAAQIFDDARLRAFAQAQAGQHNEAAQALSAFDDSDAHYNRGNALAHSGDLQAALDAYEAALQRDPGNADAAHNRDLVREQLQKQQQQQQQQQDGEAGDDDSEPQQQSSPPDQPQDGDDSASGAKGEQPDDGDARDSAARSDTASQDDASGSQPPSEADERAQAKQDARAGVAQQHNEQPHREVPQQAQGQASDDAPPAEAPRQGFEQTPRSEADLAADQWLQRIPDDPGGLLRRKFLMEHMLRQQEQQQ